MFLEEGEDRSKQLEDIAQLVVDICNRIADWISQLRRWEDKTEETKHKLYLKLEKVIKQTIQDTSVDVETLANSYKTLSSQVDQLNRSKEYAEQRMESFKVQYEDKKKECDWL
jgi:predicted RNase H-like nuclease (RuvC/YqgF family)